MPISIQNHIAKPFELLVLIFIQPSFNFNLIYEQFGLRPSRSATTNLIVFHNFLLEVIEKRTQADVIFTDLSKTFDRVDHKILIIEVLIKQYLGSPFYLSSTEFKLSSSLKALYCSFVQPFLEYSSILWDPFTAADSSQIVFRRHLFCKFNIQHMIYSSEE